LHESKQTDKVNRLAAPRAPPHHHHHHQAPAAAAALWQELSGTSRASAAFAVDYRAPLTAPASTRPPAPCGVFGAPRATTVALLLPPGLSPPGPTFLRVPSAPPLGFVVLLFPSFLY
jgi:hypothetical protein